jgi:TfoX/Sxy family transcriptional regulator of competence genes
MAQKETPSQAFAEYVVEQIDALGNVSTRRFFSGTAIVIGELQLGFVSRDETLYLRLNPDDRAELERLGGQPFAYARSGKARVTPGYFSVPGDIIDDRPALTDWAQRAYAFAQSMHKPKRGRT